MIRRSFLPQARPALLLVMLSMAPALMAFAQDAAAQDAATQERLDRIERDLSMLQRQVYRDSGDTAPAGVAGTSTAVNLQVRMDRLEQQMRDLTGRVENMTNEVEQLRQRLEQVNSDIDVRLGQGQAQLSGSAEPPPPRRPPGSHEMAARRVCTGDRRGGDALWPPAAAQRFAAARSIGELRYADPPWLGWAGAGPALPEADRIDAADCERRKRRHLASARRGNIACRLDLRAIQCSVRSAAAGRLSGCRRCVAQLYPAASQGSVGRQRAVLAGRKLLCARQIL